MHEWLKDYQKLQEDIEYLEFSLEVNKDELDRWEGGDLSNIFLTKESKGSKVEENIEKIKDELDSKINQKKRMVRLISKFKGLDSNILRLKYIEGMTLETIAEELKYSSGYIQKKHAEIMRMIRFSERVDL